MIGTFWSLVPAIVAITLALITKEVYSSLFVGILLGGFFYAGFSFSGVTTHVLQNGLIGQISDPYNAGILVFLVMLGIMVCLMNQAGGSAAFGRWAKKHIKTKIGAQLATICLGVLIFVDDYFNCLTVGSVMRPITDKYKVSREKLAYLIDSTAAPVCIIAPISSWAAAVSGFVSEGENGIALFCKAIPYNFYAILTIFMMIILVLSKCDYGSMNRFERAREMLEDEVLTKDEASTKGRVIDLVIPIIVLIISCTLSMVYSGGFFTKDNECYMDFVNSFANCDASVGLVLGSFITVIFTIIFYLFRGVLSFKDSMSCIPQGFCSMVPAILILALAWTLKGVTDSLGAKEFVADIVSNSAQGLKNFLPAIVFIIACFLAFATGTSWGTFGILIPICIAVFPESTDTLRVICISACMAGAVCGDHCSPISDTTIMASAGAQCNHVNHVNSQLPYAITVAIVSFITYIVAGWVKNAAICIVVGMALLFASIYVINKFFNKK